MLQSLQAQAYEPIEVIVVDDSGEGYASDVVGDFDEVVYVRLPDNRGAQAARNAGLDIANGEYVWFLDDDDQLRPSAVSKQVAALREHPNAGVTVCGIEFTHGGFHLPTTNPSRPEIERALEFWNGPFRYSTVLVERSLLDRIGPLDESFEGAGDIWMRIELARITDFVAIEEPLVLVAKREQQMEAGENADHLGFSRAALEARWKLFERYEALYDEVDPNVRRFALADAHRLEGLLNLYSCPWSPQAIIAFARTAYYTPSNRPQHLAELAASLFGRSGHKLGQSLRDGVLHRLDRLRGRE
ncbi:glycosyl transferase [Halococcus saccharolyticus DSM 5350]|uniref:Glycosyl transferase n=2 Tax=Halococcus saccharolyticus TaxID=62319 RepID=M0MN39_9EURY|nr:glycosyl transferase [Halococcus saccharolyticus DSM 5350]